MSLDADVSSSYVRCAEPAVTAFVWDRIGPGYSPWLVPAAAKEAKARLVVRSAREIFEPERFVADMCRFSADVRFIADAYGVPTVVVAEVVHDFAARMAADWRRMAEAEAAQ